jgi:hypothetical protein
MCSSLWLGSSASRLTSLRKAAKALSDDVRECMGSPTVAAMKKADPLCSGSALASIDAGDQ